MVRAPNGAEYTIKFLERSGVQYFFGIPGHGNVCVFDAVKEAESMKLVMVKHEQMGGHMADGYFRANRRVPAVVGTSVGPGATNLATPLATAFVDSSSFIALTGDIQTYLFGMGIFQEVDRKRWVDYTNGISHFTKQAWQVTNPSQLSHVLPNAFKIAVTGRPGPVLIDLPMDIQVGPVHEDIPRAENHLVTGRVYPDPSAIKKVADILLSAERPLILIGGGVTMSGATEELVAVAEFLGAPVVCSFRGDAKGGFPADHELWAYHCGNVGSPIANTLTKETDVLLVIGTTLSDETASSFRRGVTFNIPPTKVVQMDIESNEIAKNYPVEVGIVSDAKSGLKTLLAALSRLSSKRQYHRRAWFKRMRALRVDWEAEMKKQWSAAPMAIPSIAKIVRDVLPRDGILTVSAGLSQEILSQQWQSYVPGTYLSSGGFSTMGFGLPAAMGAKLAKPKSPVLAVEGDGSFLMNSMELSTAVEYHIPVVVVLLNNYGWISIRDLQMRNFKKRVFGTEFKNHVDFEKLVRGYGAEYKRADSPAELKQAVTAALNTDAVSVVEARVERRFPKDGTDDYGFWDIPSPYLK